MLMQHINFVGYLHMILKGSVFESDQLDEAKRQYFQKQMERLLTLVKEDYDTRRSFEYFVSLLDDLVKWLLSEGQAGKEGGIYSVLEGELVDKLEQTEEDSQLEDMLDIVHARYLQWLRKNEGLECSQGVVDHGNFFSVEIDRGAFVLPHKESEVLMDRQLDLAQWMEKFRVRIEELVRLLSVMRIRKDDFIVLKGALPGMDMARSVYALIEIPFIRKQILLCDKLEEPSLVIHRHIPREVLTRIGFQDLQVRYGEDVELISGSKFDQETDIYTAVQRSVDIQQSKRINTRLREEVISFIKERGGDKRRFVSMKADDRREFYQNMHRDLSVGGTKCRRFLCIEKPIGRQFSPFLYTSHHKMIGRAVFGDDELFED